MHCRRNIKTGLILALTCLSYGVVAFAQSLPAPGLLSDPNIPLRRELYDNPDKTRDIFTEQLQPSGDSGLGREGENSSGGPLIDTGEADSAGTESGEGEEGEAAIVLSELKIDGVTIFNSESLSQVLSPWIGREVTFQQLLEIAEDINKLYREKGYITTRTVIPPQKVENGVVALQVIEGRIGEIKVQGNHYAKKFYINRRIDEDKGDVFQLRMLEKDIVRLNNDPQIKEARAVLEPGENPGESNIVINIKDERPYHLSFNFDNTGRERLGRYYYGTTASHDNLLGLGDQLLLNVNVSDNKRTRSVFGQYKVPLTRWGLTAGANFASSQIELSSPQNGQDILDDNDATVKTRQYSVFTEIPVLRTRHVDLTLDAGYKAYHYNFFWQKKNWQDFWDEMGIETGPLDQIHAAYYGATVQERDLTGRTILRAGMENGRGIMNALQGGGQDGRKGYFRFNGQVSRIQNLGKGFMLVLQGQTQLSDDELSSLLSYQVGGTYSVRGYKEGAFAGDEGYQLSAELRFPMVGAPRRIRDNFQGLLFMDHAGTFINGDGARGFVRKDGSLTQEAYLTSAGFGLRGRLSRFLIVRADVGFMLTPVDDNPDLGVHFGITSPVF